MAIVELSVVLDNPVAVAVVQRQLQITIIVAAVELHVGQLNCVVLEHV